MDEKQEDHPLWPAFMEWFASDAIAGIHFLSPAKVWRIWLAGAEAAETARGGDMDTNRIRHKQITAKLDRILEILGSPQEFSMNFRLAAEPPQTGSKSGG